jgi:tetratricopeptide (TPR) repeat protein
MQFIWASRVGLTEKEILQLLKVSPVEWATIRNALDECLLESSGKISFAHDYMRIAVKDLYLKNQSSERLIHIELAKFFQKQAPDTRRIEEEPFQWEKAQEWDSLKKCLLNHEIFSLLIGKSSIELSQYWLVLEHETKEKLEDQYFKAWQRWKKQLDAKDFIKKSLELAEFMRMSSRYLMSLKILQPLLILSENVLGKTHEKTQAILSLMGNNYTALANYDQSLKYLLKVLDIRTKKYGLNHIKTADSINFVSVNYYYAGKFKEANQLSKKVYAIRKKLGLSGEPISEIVNNLANLASELGEFDAAEKYHFQALEIRKKFFGENSWQVGQNFNNLGALMEKEGRFDEAIEYYQKSLTRYEEALGKGADYIKTLSNLGLTLSYQGLENNEGNSLQKEALLLAEKVFGDHHPEVARILSNLAFSEEELEVKKELLLRALDIFRKTLGSHQLTIGCLNMIGGVSDDLDELDSAEDYLKEAVNMTKKISLLNSKIGADAVYCLGNFYYRNDLQDNGIQLFLESIDIYKKLNGPMYLFLLRPLGDLAKQYFYNEDYENAERYYRWNLKINEFHYGKEHINTALSLNNVGAILTKQGKNIEAEPFYLRALSIREKNLDPLDSEIGISVFNLGTLYLEINRYELAEKNIKRAIDIFQESAPEYVEMANERLQNLYDQWKKA